MCGRWGETPKHRVAPWCYLAGGAKAAHCPGAIKSQKGGQVQYLSEKICVGKFSCECEGGAPLHKNTHGTWGATCGSWGKSSSYPRPWCYLKGGKQAAKCAGGGYSTHSGKAWNEAMCHMCSVNKGTTLACPTRVAKVEVEEELAGCDMASDCSNGYGCIDGACVRMREEEELACEMASDCSNGFGCMDGECVRMRAEEELERGHGRGRVIKCATSATCPRGRGCVRGMCVFTYVKE